MFHIDLSLGLADIICEMHLKYIIHNVFTCNSQILYENIQLKSLGSLCITPRETMTFAKSFNIAASSEMKVK